MDDRIRILYELHIKTRKYQQLYQHRFLNCIIQHLMHHSLYVPRIPHIIPILAFCFCVILAKFVQSADKVERNAAAADIITLKINWWFYNFQNISGLVTLGQIRISSLAARRANRVLILHSNRIVILLGWALYIWTKLHPK